MQVLGAETRFDSAFTGAGAAIVTFFTFLPRFIFILIGAPFIETTRGRLTVIYCAAKSDSGGGGRRYA